MTLRHTKLAARLYQFSQIYVLPAVNRYFKSPNQLTTAGAVLAVGVPFGFYIHPIFGCLMLIFSAFIDVLDGLFARTTGQSSDLGAFWDSSLDRISDFFYLIGFGIIFTRVPNFILASFFIGYAIASTFMISYVKAKAESLGKSCHSGIMERGFRTIFMIIWAFSVVIAPEATRILLWLGIFAFCLLNTVTVIQRMIEIRSQFPSDKHLG